MPAVHHRQLENPFSNLFHTDTPTTAVNTGTIAAAATTTSDTAAATTTSATDPLGGLGGLTSTIASIIPTIISSAAPSTTSTTSTTISSAPTTTSATTPSAAVTSSAATLTATRTTTPVSSTASVSSSASASASATPIHATSIAAVIIGVLIGALSLALIISFVLVSSPSSPRHTPINHPTAPLEPPPLARQGKGVNQFQRRCIPHGAEADRGEGISGLDDSVPVPDDECARSGAPARRQAGWVLASILAHAPGTAAAAADLLAAPAPRVSVGGAAGRVRLPWRATS
ncbi:hypothetical protein DFH09DRAFT_300737 [Mycena vulgaris]|nr:hypothetical protein DFH09DRAFT_300737 [Mycena vulgaris]